MQLCIKYELKLFATSLLEQYSKGKKWIFFCEDMTQVNLKRLLRVLDTYPSEKVVEKYLLLAAS